VLVEGPGCVWKLEMAGVDYAVAMFGSELSDQQQVLLEMSGAMNVVVLTDMDEAGMVCRQAIKMKLGRSFRVYSPLLKGNDVGEMTVQQIRSDIVPVLNKIKGIK
jgi:DNA primase